MHVNTLCDAAVTECMRVAGDCSLGSNGGVRGLLWINTNTRVVVGV